MKKSKIFTILISVICTIAISVGTTFALLIAFSGPVENTFTVGNVTIELNETTGGNYHLLPGATLNKDPKVTVKSGSEDCWLFVKVTPSPTLHHYLSYEIESGWQALDGESDVFYTSGLKTGFTTAAGNCLLSSFTVEDRHLLVGVFGCAVPDNRFADTLLILADLFDVTIPDVPVSQIPHPGDSPSLPNKNT